MDNDNNFGLSVSQSSSWDTWVYWSDIANMHNNCHIHLRRRTVRGVVLSYVQKYRLVNNT